MSLVVKVEESAGFELHAPDEWHSGMLYSIEEAEDRGYGPGLKWIFHLDGDLDPISDAPRETWGFSGQKVTSRTKAGRWVAGIKGDLPEPGEVIDLGQLFGTPVDVMFEHVPGMDRDGNPQTKEKVEKVRASRPGGVTQVPSPPPAPEVPAEVPAPVPPQPEPVQPGQLYPDPY